MKNISFILISAIVLCFNASSQAADVQSYKMYDTPHSPIIWLFPSNGDKNCLYILTDENRNILKYVYSHDPCNINGK
jgi:hypothetical protein